MSEREDWFDGDVDEAVVVEVARETLRGDIRDFLLDRLKHDKEVLPWDAQNEGKQRETIAAANSAAERLIEKVANIVCGEGRVVVHMALEQITIKDGIKATLSCPNLTTAREHLGAAQGSTVAVIFLSTEHVQGQRKPRFAKKDEPSLLDQPEEGGPVCEPPPPTTDQPPGDPPPATEPPADPPAEGPQDEPEVARAKRNRKKS